MEWKTNDLLLVSGETARAGAFSPMEHEGKATFSREFLKNLFANFNAMQPLHLTHTSKDVDGYITSLGYDEGTDTIHYKGFVFNKEAKQRVEEDGFDSISPEIVVTEGDEANPINGYFSGFAFTRRPAIPGTSVSKNVISFSEIPESIENTPKQEEQNMVAETTTTVSNTSTPAMSVAEVELAKKQIEEQMNNYKNTISDLTNNVNKLTTDIESYKQTSASYKEKYEALLSSEVTKLEGELKEMGVEKPTEFAANLGIEDRIEVLKSAKVNFVKAAPISSPPAATVKADNKSSSEKKIEAAKANGIPEQFLKYIH